MADDLGMPSKCLRTMRATSFIGATLERRTLVHRCLSIAATTLIAHSPACAAALRGGFAGTAASFEPQQHQTERGLGETMSDISMLSPATLSSSHPDRRG